MKIVNSLLEDFGNFELDIGAIEFHSISQQDIILPYNGALPKKMPAASDASIVVNIRPTRGALLLLRVDVDGEHSPITRQLDASDHEVISLLDKFFKPGGDTGLDPLWYGFFNANYFEWRSIASDPARLLNILGELPMEEQAYMLIRWLEPLKEVLKFSAEYSEQFETFYKWVDSVPKDAIKHISGRKWLSDI